jgi:hypothetical protein
LLRYEGEHRLGERLYGKERKRVREKWKKAKKERRVGKRPFLKSHVHE